ncbi:SIR2 family NAD-dependent protein deacylase [Reinekea marinisedimentorum]|uniref:NAD-dependent protein deacylase n=1 Tax=Reinekea marinisedimentorum TaxID=230495 RepID=A0A4R3HWW7_9GAMM|nr:Sir2 family NAD-dependent protein deacetylase [Reinekea marinisedimentorum]TCS35899.1 NAD-dependent deacetylase [Reinekea marinisedimentorum]
MSPIREKVVVFTGAGVSAESGIQTFRDANGLWHNHNVQDICSLDGWHRNPEMVLNFYNQRRADVKNAAPNKAHEAIASLQEKYEVVVVTQNIDDLHERAGSETVLHVHGEVTKARSSEDETLIYDISYEPIELGHTCSLGSQLRPHIVWFGEAVNHIQEAYDHFLDADKVLVVGTSLQVYPVAGLVHEAPLHAEKVIVSLDVENVPSGYEYIQQKAASSVPEIAARWLAR